jgi:hypothetical protein
MCERIAGIITFKISTYQTVAKDKNATKQAGALVVVVTLIQWVCSNLIATMVAGGTVNLSQAFCPHWRQSFLGWRYG